MPLEDIYSKNSEEKEIMDPLYILWMCVISMCKLQGCISLSPDIQHSQLHACAEQNSTCMLPYPKSICVVSIQLKSYDCRVAKWLDKIDLRKT